MKYASDLLTNEPLDNVKKDLESSPQMFDTYLDSSIELFKPIEGTNKIRIVPPYDFRTDFPKDIFNGRLGLKVFAHSWVTPAQDSYLCNKIMKGEKCPFCEAFLKYKQVDYERAKQYRPRPRILVWLLDYNMDVPKLKLWLMPPTVVSSILEVAYDDDLNKYTPLLNLEDGHIVRFVVSKEGNYNKYSGFKLLRPEPINEHQLAGMKPYTEILKYYDYEYMKERMSYIPEPPEIPEDSVDDIPDVEPNSDGLVDDIPF